MTCELPEDSFLSWNSGTTCMTDVRQSRKDPHNLINLRGASLLTPKATLRLGCWNVRTLYQIGKTANVTREFRKYNMDILGLSEVRWTGFGVLRTATGESILYSGAEEEHHRGVGLILNREVRRTLLKWNLVNERIMSARFNSRFAKLAIIQVYAPTNDAEDESKEEFYEQLQREVVATPRHDILIVMGDLNAKIGQDNEGWEKVMGQHGLGRMNENGERLATFCGNNDLVIGGSLFKHKDIHKITWTSPNARDQNQIDHIIINGRYRGSLMDTRAMRGADANSDHHMVMGKVRLKLCSTKRKSKERIIFDTTKLRDPCVKEAFRLEVSNRFQVLATEDVEDIEEKWGQFKEVYNESAKKVLGEKRRMKSDWISGETYKKIEERRRLKEKIGCTRSSRLKERATAAYVVKDKEVKASARADKRRRLNNLAEEAETAARNNCSSDLYQLTRKIAGQRRNMTTIKDREGKRLVNEDEVLERWREHFEGVLNVPRPDIPLPEMDQAPEVIPSIEAADISIAEIKRAIHRLKNGKSPGIDAISAEMLKCSENDAVKQLHSLFNSIWKDQCVPEDWKKSLIVKVPKKGGLTECDNYRGISLLSVPCKILCRLLIDRVKSGVDEMIRQEQAVFRSGRGTSEQIFVLRNILEQSQEWQAPVYINFVDFSKAFDCIIRERLWDIMRQYGIPDIFIRTFKALYHQSSSCVTEGGRFSSWFEVKSGVRQGCPMSGFIFVLTMDWVMRHTNNRRRGLRWKLTSVLEDLDYADDVALISSRFADLQEKTDRLVATAGIVGLKLNPRKTKTLRMNHRCTDYIRIEGEEVEDVESFVHLGSVLDKLGGTEVDIKRRLALARIAFTRLQNIWRSGRFSQKTKLRILNSNVLSVLLYGAEMWRVTSTDLNKVDVFHRSCLRRVLRRFWPYHLSNEELYKATGTTPVSALIRERRWRWIGHILRTSPNNISRTALTWAPEGKRRRGRPRETWRRTAEKERNQLAFVGACGCVGGRPGWMARSSGRP